MDWKTAAFYFGLLVVWGLFMIWGELGSIARCLKEIRDELKKRRKP